MKRTGIYVNVAGLTLDEIEAIGAALMESGDLAKAVAAHPAQVQQRGKGGRFQAYKWRRETARDTYGRFASRLNPVERAEATLQAERTSQRLHEKLGWCLDDVNTERLGSDEASRRGAKYITEYYEQAMRNGMQAAGNPAILLSPHQKAVLSRITRDEIDYFAGFMSDVANGRGRIPYDKRLDMYRNACREPYWIGYVIGNVAPKRLITWNLGPTDHCTTCQAMAKHGPWSVDAFLREALTRGYVPQSGYLACKGIRCKCSLSDNT